MIVNEIGDGSVEWFIWLRAGSDGGFFRIQ